MLHFLANGLGHLANGLAARAFLLKDLGMLVLGAFALALVSVSVRNQHEIREIRLGTRIRDE